MAETQQFDNETDNLTIRTMLNSELKYSSTYEYNTNDKCFYLGKLYVSVVDRNIDHIPTNDGIFWRDPKLDAPTEITTTPSLSDTLPIIQSGVVKSVSLSDIMSLSNLGSNLLLNSGFESGTVSNWTNSANGGSVSVQSVIKHSGSYSLHLAQGALSSSNAIAYQTITVVPDTTYQLSFWYRDDGTNAPIFAVYGETVPKLYVIPKTNLTVVGDTWTRFITNFTTNSYTKLLWVSIQPAKVANAYVYFDDCAINSLDASAGTTTNPEIIPMPSNLVAVVGEELQLFKRGMIVSEDPDNLSAEISAYTYVDSVKTYKGKAYKRYFSYTPEQGDAGSAISLVINLLNNEGDISTTATQNIIVKDVPVQPAAKKIMILGDSLTFNDNQDPANNAFYPNELCRRLTGTGTPGTGFPAGKAFTDITFIGNQEMANHADQLFTGFPGWKLSDYIGTTSTANGFVIDGTHGLTKKDVGGIWTDGASYWYISKLIGANQFKVFTTSAVVTPPPESGTLSWYSGLNGSQTAITYTAVSDAQPASPFYIGGALDLSAWVTEQSTTAPDIMYLLCGWNNTRAVTDTTKSGWLASAYFTSIKAFATHFNTEFPTAKLVLVGLQSPSINGGLGNDYGTGDRSNYFKMLLSVSHLNQAYEELSKTSPYSGYMGYINLQAQFDSEYGYERIETSVNTRNTTDTEFIDASGIHPCETGYYQISDAVYRDFVNRYC